MVTPTNTNSLLHAARDYACSHLDTGSITEAEDQIQKITRMVANAMMGEVAARMSGKPTYRGVRVSCECGKEAAFKEYRERFVRTLHGDVQVVRAYYRCHECTRSYIPWDQEQGLDERVWSPRVKELVASICGALPYAAASTLIERTTGIRIEESSEEGIVRDIGERLRLEEREAIVGAVDVGKEIGCEESPERLYISMDAAKAHTDGEWHDIKTCVVYEGERADGKDTDTVHNPHYVAAQERSEEFGRRIYTKAMLLGYDKARMRIVLGDGADWIWNEARNHLGESIKIVDYWHACEHIYSFAAALYGDGDPKGKRWAKEHCEKLKAKGPGSLLRAMKRRKPRNEREQEALRLEQGYFTRLRRYMDYPKYRSLGLMIGSGPVESACKVVVGQRLKQAGMRWTKDGADAVLAVRTALLSGEFDRLERAARAA